MLRAKVRAGGRSKSKRLGRAYKGKRKITLKRGRRLHGRGIRKHKLKRRGKLHRRRFFNRRRRRNSAPRSAVVRAPKAGDKLESYQNYYSDAYQKGFDSGFSQGFEDGHKIGYKEQV
ncbi:MAG TPA: hypothetical protein VGN02_10775 [Paenibacillus sp.]|jgi:hypothetical protein